MAQRAPRRGASPKAAAAPRAKSIPPRWSAETAKELDRFAEASESFDQLTADRASLGAIDASYGELCVRAGSLLRALAGDPGARRLLSADVLLAASRLARGERAIDQSQDDDVTIAERALRESR